MTPQTPDPQSTGEPLVLDLGAVIGPTIAELTDLHKSLIRLDQCDHINLTDWEASFVESCLRQHDQHRPWSEKQIETLKNLLDKYGF